LHYSDKVGGRVLHYVEIIEYYLKKRECCLRGTVLKKKICHCAPNDCRFYFSLLCGSQTKCASWGWRAL